MTISTLDRFLKGVGIAILAALMLLVASALVFFDRFFSAVYSLVKSTESAPREAQKRSPERASPSVKTRPALRAE